MTHAELVDRAEKWLRSSGCQTVVTRASVMTLEQPDAIGWPASGFSKLVECKVSRADFLRDAKKPHRGYNGLAMGCFRYFLVPCNLVTADEIPLRWGLLYAAPRGIRVVRTADQFPEWNVREELKHLLAECRRRDGMVRYPVGREKAAS